MLKIHIYHGNGKTATIKANQMIGLTILRQDSVLDSESLEGGYIKPKGQQLVMLEVTEKDGELFISNLATDEKIKF